MNIAVIGGGAAGFFAAIATKENYPNSQVVIFEKSQKLLAKVKVSGGGRCNVTNACPSVAELSKSYPRGGKKLKNAFQIFNNKHTMKWFESRGVPLMIQDNHYVFPQSQKSQTIVDCLLRESEKLKIRIEVGMAVKSLSRVENQIVLEFLKENHHQETFDKVIVTTGGSPKRSGFEWLEQLNHKIEDPVPSLFTFNMPHESITQLMGVAVENTLIKIQGTKLSANGALLITHWGMSGPAVLKLSAFGARILNDIRYNFKVQVNWTNEPNHGLVSEQLQHITLEHANKILANIKPFSLSERLWLFLLKKSDLSNKKKWGELGKKGLNKLVNVLTNDVYEVMGKTTFKEEFVTCGGVSLNSIDINTMQSKICENLYFAGEVMDIDAITGGFNFQAAWTTGYIAGKLG